MFPAEMLSPVGERLSSFEEGRLFLQPAQVVFESRQAVDQIQPREKTAQEIWDALDASGKTVAKALSMFSFPVREETLESMVEQQRRNDPSTHINVSAGLMSLHDSGMLVRQTQLDIIKGMIETGDAPLDEPSARNDMRHMQYQRAVHDLMKYMLRPEAYPDWEIPAFQLAKPLHEVASSGPLR